MLTEALSLCEALRTLSSFLQDALAIVLNDNL